MKKIRISLLFTIFAISSIAFAGPKQIANLKRVIELTIEENERLKAQIDNELSALESEAEKKAYLKELSTGEDPILFNAVVISAVLMKSANQIDFENSIQTNHKKTFDNIKTQLLKTKFCLEKNSKSILRCTNSIFSCKMFGKDANGSLYINSLNSQLNVERKEIQNSDEFSKVFEEKVKEREKFVLKSFGMVGYNICVNDLQKRESPKIVTLPEATKEYLFSLHRFDFNSCKENYKKQIDAKWKLFSLDSDADVKYHYNSIKSAISSCEKIVGNICSNVTIGTKYDFFTFPMNDCTTETLSTDELKNKISTGYENDSTKEIFANALEDIDRCKPAKEAGFTWFVNKQKIAKEGCSLKTSNHSDSSSTGSYCARYCHKGKACGNSCIASWKSCHQPPGSACDI